LAAAKNWSDGKVSWRKLIPDAREASTAVNLTFPTLTGPDAVLAAMNSVVERMGSGAVTPTAANQMVTLLGQYARAYETSVLEQRVADLERGRPSGEFNGARPVCSGA
jgi:hypothetical protein